LARGQKKRTRQDKEVGGLAANVKVRQNEITSKGENFELKAGLQKVGGSN